MTRPTRFAAIISVSEIMWGTEDNLKEIDLEGILERKFGRDRGPSQ